MLTKRAGVRISLLALMMIVDSFPGSAATDAVARNGFKTTRDIWNHENLFAWCVVPFDSKKRKSEERAQMLSALGFRSFAYDWREKDIPTFDDEVNALAKHSINLLAWWFPFDADDPAAKATLELFRRHKIHPQLWIPQSSRGSPKTDESMTKTPEEQRERIRQETDRIYALVKLAGSYGVNVELYNHNGWFGMEGNQLEIIERLKTLGVNNVGMVYNFSHARDELHDDTQNFQAIWKRIEPYVVAVNITGTHMDGDLIYPSQGDRELQMMKVIRDSGWRGPVGLIAEKGGDAEVTLKNYLIGLDWLAAELRESGSGGPRPFPLAN